MASDYVQAYAGPLQLGALQLVSTVPPDKKHVLKDVVVSNPYGGAPVYMGYAWACCPGEPGVLYYSVSNGATGAAIVEVKSSPVRGWGNAQLVAGMPGVAGTTNGTGQAARFSAFVCGLVYKAGKLYIADTNNNKIRVMDTTTYAVTDFAGSGVSGQADATGVLATFVGPRSITINSAGTTLYVGQTAASPAVSLRAVTVPGAVVTTRSSTQAAAITGAVDSVSLSADGLYLWFIERDTTSANTSVYRYTLASSTRTLVSQDVGAAASVSQSSGNFAIGAAAWGLYGSSAYATLCCDPVDNAVVYLHQNGDTFASGATNCIQRLVLMGPYTAPTHFQVGNYALKPGTTGNTAEGIGLLGPNCFGAQKTLAPVASGPNLIFCDGSSSAYSRLLAINTEDAFCSFINLGSTSTADNYGGITNAGHNAYLNLYTQKSGSSEIYRIFSRQALALGETLQISRAQPLNEGDKIYAMAQNAMLNLEIGVLELDT